MLHHLKAVWAFRYFWASLVRMDLRSRYRRSVLGIGWSVLHPVAMSGVFCLVFSQIMPMTQSDIDGYPAPWRGYAAYLLTGVAVWDFIRTSTTAGCLAFLHNESYLRQCPLPMSIYPLRTVLGAGVHFAISMGVVAVLVAVLKGDPVGVAWVAWAVVPGMALALVFCWALATLAAFATVYFHDTHHLTEVGASLFFFLTPIIYTRDRLGAIQWLADLNPVNLFLELIRTPVVTGAPPDLGLYAQAAAVTAAAVGLAGGTIGWLQKKVIFQL